MKGILIMNDEEEKKIFLEYFNQEKIYSSDCKRNHKNKKIVFYKEINDKKFWIKKYIPYGKRKFTIALGLKKDYVEHYKYISRKLDSIGVEHVRAYYTRIKKDGFFKRQSLLITEDAGISLENYIKDFNKYIEWFKYFFDLYIFLAKNKIYCTDYNLDGILVGNDHKLRLIDLDAYKYKLYINKKFKKYLIEELNKNYLDMNRGKEFEEFCKKEIKRIKKELKWD